jgi:hypothetical protein
MRLLYLLAVLSLGASAACASATAKARTDPAPLSIPEPPPRLIEPLPEVEELPAAEPERREAPAPPVRSSRPNRENGSSRETKTVENPKPVEPVPEPPAPALPPAPRAELRTPEMADEDATARKVRETLEAAAKTLAKVDYRTLGKEGQENYNTAKRFMEQAEEALRARNPIAAKLLADKADTIATALTGR